jgi:hypothetical protein
MAGIQRSRFLRLSNVERGGVVGRSMKSTLRISVPFLKALHTAFSAKTLINKMYEASIGTLRGDSDTAGYPNGYAPSAKLKDREVAKTIFLAHMAKKNVHVSKDETMFFMDHVMPKLTKRITGRAHDDKIFMSSELKANILYFAGNEVIQMLEDHFKTMKIPFESAFIG